MAIKYTWLGHGTHGLEIGGKRLVVDPFFTSNPAAPIKAEAVQADYILVSHGHSDHVEDLIEVAKRTGAMVISNFEIIDWLKQQGIAEDKTHAMPNSEIGLPDDKPTAAIFRFIEASLLRMPRVTPAQLSRGQIFCLTRSCEVTDAS